MARRSKCSAGAVPESGKFFANGKRLGCKGAGSLRVAAACGATWQTGVVAGTLAKVKPSAPTASPSPSRSPLQMNRCAICAESAPASTFGLTPHGPICTTCGVRHFSTLVGPNGLALPPQASVEEVTRLAAMLSKIADLRARRLDHAWDEIVKAFDGELFKTTLCEWLDDPTLHTPYGTSQLAEVHDTEGITLLHYAAAYGGPAAVQKLLEH